MNNRAAVAAIVKEVEMQQLYISILMMGNE